MRSRSRPSPRSKALRLLLALAVVLSGGPWMGLLAAQLAVQNCPHAASALSAASLPASHHGSGTESGPVPPEASSHACCERGPAGAMPCEGSDCSPLCRAACTGTSVPALAAAPLALREPPTSLAAPVEAHGEPGPLPNPALRPPIRT